MQPLKTGSATDKRGCGQTGKSRSEQMFSGLPPKADIQLWLLRAL
jgi:hypothetical protein